MKKLFKSSYNLMYDSNQERFIPFSCIADLLATAKIINLIEACQRDFYTITKGGHISSVNQVNAVRTLTAIDWDCVERKIDLYLELREAGNALYKKKELLFPLIKWLVSRNNQELWLDDVLTPEWMSERMIGYKK